MLMKRKHASGGGAGARFQPPAGTGDPHKAGDMQLPQVNGFRTLRGLV